MKSILITGGQGLVGSNVAEFLRKKGYTIYNVDRKEKFSQGNIVCDLSKKEHIEKLPKDIDYILHFAAEVDEKDLDKENLLRNNVLSTLNILEYAKKIRVKKFIYTSSSAVYGKVKCYPIKEDFDTKPESIYGLSKLFGEELCELYRKKGLPIITFRLGYVLAPLIPERYFIHKIMRKLDNNEPIKVFNGNTNSLSFIDVEDISRFCEEGLESDITGVFNLTGFGEVKAKEVIDLVAKNFEDYSGKITEEENNELMRNNFSNERLYSVFKRRYVVKIKDSINKITSNFKQNHKEQI